MPVSSGRLVPPAASAWLTTPLGAPGATAGYLGLQTLSWRPVGTGYGVRQGPGRHLPGTPGPRADLSLGECNSSVCTVSPWFREQNYVRWQKINEWVLAAKGPGVECPEGTPVQEGLFRGQWTQACFECGQVGGWWPLVKAETLSRKGGSPSLKRLTHGCPGNEGARSLWARPRGGQRMPSCQRSRSRMDAVL